VTISPSTSTFTNVATPDGPMQVYEAAPAGATSRAVLVVHDGFGTGPSVRAMCDVLAGAGWYVLCPQLYHRSGHVEINHDNDFTLLGEALESDTHVLADLDSTLVLLGDRGFAPDATAILGFCWGGRGAFLGALERPFAAAVSFYGTGIVEALELPGVQYAHPQLPLISDSARLRCPWLGVFAGADPFVPADHVARLHAELDRVATVPHEVRTFDGQPHGFVHHGVATSADITGAARTAWDGALAFLDTHFPAS
jgi:carboxymethylenebutenolidase